EAEAAGSARAVHPAAFLRRAGAAGIDAGVLVGVWLLALPALFAVLVWLVDAPTYTVAVAEVLALAVVASFEVLGTAGVGKTVLGLRIAGVDDQGVPAARQMLARAAMKYVPLLAGAGLLAARAADRMHGAAYTGVLPHVGFGAAAAGVLAGPVAIAYVLGWLASLLPGGRSLHDRMAGTAVYEVYDLVRLRARRGSGVRAGFDVRVAPVEPMPVAVTVPEPEWIEAPPVVVKDEMSPGGP
ncbi:MAG TPA: RDD family protein, partial [Humisphaera sp.]